MASIQNTTRRTAFALAVAVATIAAPAAAFFVASPDLPATRVVADCTESGIPGDPSLDCAPADIPAAGAPSEMEVTDANVGIASPIHGSHR